MFPFQVFILLILLLLLLLAPSFPSPIFLSSLPLLILFPFQFFFLYLLLLQAPTSSILRRVNSAHCGVYYMYGDVIFLASPSFCHTQKWCLPLLPHVPMGVSVDRPLASIKTAYFGKHILTIFFFLHLFHFHYLHHNLFLILLISCSNSMTQFFSEILV